MFEIKYKLKPSLIHGIGVFADEFIERGTIISRIHFDECVWYFNEKELYNAVSNMTYEEAQKYLIFTYGWDMDEDHPHIWFHDLSDGKHINHSFTPNVGMINGQTTADDKLYALCDIKKGEEIYMNYITDEYDPWYLEKVKWWDQLLKHYNVWRPLLLKNIKLDDTKHASVIKNGTFYEKQPPNINKTYNGMCVAYQIKHILELKHTNNGNEILIFDGEDSRFMVLNGIIQFDTDTGPYVNEMMVHVPLFAHKNPKKVLIIGCSGVGGICDEVIMHKSIENVIWIEKDKYIVDLSKKYFRNIYTDDVINAINDKQI
eukprot:452245_1